MFVQWKASVLRGGSGFHGSLRNSSEYLRPDRTNSISVSCPLRFFKGNKNAAVRRVPLPAGLGLGSGLPGRQHPGHAELRQGQVCGAVVRRSEEGPGGIVPTGQHRGHYALQQRRDDGHGSGQSHHSQQLGTVRRHVRLLRRHRGPGQVQDEVLGGCVLPAEWERRALGDRHRLRQLRRPLRLQTGGLGRHVPGRLLLHLLAPPRRAEAGGPGRGHPEEDGPVSAGQIQTRGAHGFLYGAVIRLKLMDFLSL